MATKPFLFTIALLLLLSSYGGAAQRSGGTSFGVSPPSIRLEAVPGEQVSSKIRIENPHKDVSNFKLVVSGLARKPGANVIVPLSALPADHVARNITLESPTITVPGKSYKEVSFIAKMSPTAKGTQLAGITISRQVGAGDEIDTERKGEYASVYGVGMQPAITIAIDVLAKGTAQYGYSIKGVKTSRPSPNQPPVVQVTLHNDGNTSLQINPILVMTSGNNKTTFRLKPQEQINIPAGTDVVSTFKSDGRDIAAGSYKGILTVSDPQYKISPVETTIVVK